MACFFCQINNCKVCGPSCGLCGKNCPGVEDSTASPEPRTYTRLNGMQESDYELPPT